MGKRKEYKKPKRKFCGNRFQKVEESDGCEPKRRAADEDFSPRRLSASARKIPGTSLPATHQTSEKTTYPSLSGYGLIDLTILTALFAEMPCHDCGKNNLLFGEDTMKRKGLVSYLRLMCQTCGWNYCFYTSEKVSYFFEINRRFVYAMRSIGQGESGAKRFCALMNMAPPPKPNAYNRHKQALLKCAKKVSNDTMAEAANEVHNLKGEDENGITNCGVSCDGTWQRRGYSSQNGCVTALSTDIGKCLDVEVLSKVCHACKRQERMPDSEEKRLWKQDHELKCKSNYAGSAPAMESKGVKRIFSRSKVKNKMRHTEYLGDGDGKGFDEVKDTYEDEGIEVKKKECIGHIQKRLGTALRKKKKENKGLGGKGKLTDSLIDRLQNYYGIAIRSKSGSVLEMRKAILASFQHCISSQKRCLHDNCPEGSHSWCGYKRDLANKTNLYKPGPGLPDNIIAEIKPVYARLTDSALLEKCLHGKTQNQNESLNGMIWERVPKGVFVGADTLQLGVYDAVANFNIGYQASLNILNEQGINPGKFCSQGMKSLDRLRVHKAEYKAQERNKKRRKVLRGKRKKKDDKAQQKEGVTYAAGAF